MAVRHDVDRRHRDHEPERPGDRERGRQGERQGDRRRDRGRDAGVDPQRLRGHLRHVLDPVELQPDHPRSVRAAARRRSRYARRLAAAAVAVLTAIGSAVLVARGDTPRPVTPATAAASPKPAKVSSALTLAEVSRVELPVAVRGSGKPAVAVTASGTVWVAFANYGGHAGALYRAVPGGGPARLVAQVRSAEVTLAATDHYAWLRLSTPQQPMQRLEQYDAATGQVAETYSVILGHGPVAGAGDQVWYLSGPQGRRDAVRIDGARRMVTARVRLGGVRHYIAASSVGVYVTIDGTLSRIASTGQLVRAPGSIGGDLTVVTSSRDAVLLERPAADGRIILVSADPVTLAQTGTVTVDAGTHGEIMVGSHLLTKSPPELLHGWDPRTLRPQQITAPAGTAWATAGAAAASGAWYALSEVGSQWAVIRYNIRSTG
jgi:hypothetical protein